LKKAGLDPADTQSYSPISNLTIISKLLERFVTKQVVSYLISHFIVSFQISNRHISWSLHRDSYPEGPIKYSASIGYILVNWLHLWCWTRRLHSIALIMLHYSRDWIHHIISMEQSFIGLLNSYLSDRTQRVSSAGSTSPSSNLCCGVPQGLMLGPILFLLYTSDLMSIVKRHQLLPHAYADDVHFVQIYGSCAVL